MEQKDYILEIITVLVKEKIHLRGLAKIIDVNHMMIVRKMKQLLNENIVDFKQEGKNKVFFLKKTIEARTKIFMMENYKLQRLIKRHPTLRKVIERIQEDKRLKLALLFGSYAKGLEKKDSDVDIYLETKNKEIKKELGRLDSRLSIKIGKYNKDDNLIKEINKNHVIIKGVEFFYEKNKFFN